MEKPLIFSLLLISGAAQGIFLSALLLLKKNTKVNLPLIIFIFLISIELFFQYVYATKLIFHYPHLLYLTEPLSMLSGVLILFYTRNILFNHFIFRKIDVLYFLPFILYFAYYYSSFNQTAEDKLFDAITMFHEGISSYENIAEWIAEVVVTIPFLIVSVQLLNKHQKAIKHTYSDISKYSYTVVRNLIIASVILYLFEAIIIILAIKKIEFAEFLHPLVYLFLVFIVYIIGYDALIRKSELMDCLDTKSISNSIVSGDESYNKYEKNPLSAIKTQQIIKKIDDCIRTEKPYRNPEIRLSSFSQLIEEHPNNVSQVLNDYYKKNFYDFINMHRVDEAKLLLINPINNNITITAIGFEVGFNSKSAFYASFKKIMNTSPAQYQKIATNNQ